jgi:hypothetical protein
MTHADTMWKGEKEDEERSRGTRLTVCCVIDFALCGCS